MYISSKMSILARGKSPSSTNGKHQSATAGMFDLTRQNRSPSPAIGRHMSSENIFNLRKNEAKHDSFSTSPIIASLTTTSQPKSGIIPGARPIGGIKKPASPKAAKKPASPRIIDPGPADQIEAHNPRMTDAEIKNLLVGYVSLPKKYWHTGLAYRQHIRYVRNKDNIFVRGGFIAGIGKQRGKDTLSLVNCFNSNKPGYYAWVINLDALKAIFIRRQDWDELKKSLENNV